MMNKLVLAIAAIILPATAAYGAMDCCKEGAECCKDGKCCCMNKEPSAPTPTPQPKG
jgi:hypothetical protein